ncbi:MAG: peptidoglycan D,D-transpeptidase FtsI family protein [Parvibaculales bacterium]
MRNFSAKTSSRKVPLVRPGGDLVTGVKSSMNLQLDDLERHAVDKTRHRLGLALFVFAVMFASLAGRLVHLNAQSDAVDSGGGLSAFTTPQQRPLITDRHGTLLVTHIDAYTLGARPQMIDNAEEVTAALTGIFPQLNHRRTGRLLASNSRYVDLNRGVTPRQYQDVLMIGNPGLVLTPSKKRVYPHGPAAAHILGFVSSDWRGLAGLERAMDMDVPVPDDEGKVVTTIDLSVQHAVRAELQKGVETFGAIGGGAVIMDVRNGEVLALVSLPDFDPNHPVATPQSHHFNRATQGLYELGSVFKVFTAAMALETGAVKTEDTFQTSTPLQIGNRTVKDYHGQSRPLTPREIVIYSSNIGSAQLALAVPPQTHRQFFNSLGLLSQPYFELPETSMPQVPRRWSDIRRATISYGHGINVSLLQTVAAGAAMVNGGIYYEPRLINDRPVSGQRVISPQTSALLRDMMRAVVTQGTASKADVAGYPVLGKTGTAEKIVAGAYDKDMNIASFMGAFPADDPAYAFIVMLDEPKKVPGLAPRNTAGWNAVPVAARIVERIAPLLDLMPSHMEDSLKLATFTREAL